MSFTRDYLNDIVLQGLSLRYPDTTIYAVENIHTDENTIMIQDASAPILDVTCDVYFEEDSFVKHRLTIRYTVNGYLFERVVPLESDKDRRE